MVGRNMAVPIAERIITCDLQAWLTVVRARVKVKFKPTSPHVCTMGQCYCIWWMLLRSPAAWIMAHHPLCGKLVLGAAGQALGEMWQSS